MKTFAEKNPGYVTRDVKKAISAADENISVLEKRLKSGSSRMLELQRNALSVGASDDQILRAQGLADPSSDAEEKDSLERAERMDKIGRPRARIADPPTGIRVADPPTGVRIADPPTGVRIADPPTGVRGPTDATSVPDDPHIDILGEMELDAAEELELMSKELKGGSLKAFGPMVVVIAIKMAHDYEVRELARQRQVIVDRRPTDDEIERQRLQGWDYSGTIVDGKPQWVWNPSVGVIAEGLSLTILAPDISFYSYDDTPI
jgi:hypothetical protein